MKRVKRSVASYAIGAVMVLAVGGSACNDAQDAEDTTPVIMVGSKVILWYPDDPTIEVCGAVDDEAWDAMYKALAADDKVGLAALLISERVLLIEPGTRALVIDVGWTSFEVRFLSGRYMGQIAWVSPKAVSAAMDRPASRPERGDKTPR